MLQKIQSFLSKGNRAQWCVFLLFAAAVLLKVLLFQWYCFQSIMISSLWKNPMAFWNWWLPKLSISIFVASFVFICKNKWWTIIVHVIIDLWILSNFVYFRANGLVISFEAIGMANNMQGFESSVFAYINYKIIIFISITIVYALIMVILIPAITRNLAVFFAILIPTGLLKIYDLCGIYNIVKKDIVWNGGSFLSPESFVNENDILTYVPIAIMVEYMEITSKKRIQTQSDKMKLEHLSKIGDEVKPFLNNTDNVSNLPKPQYNLLFMLVESLESWVIDMTDANGKLIAPNLHDLAHNDANLYCTKVKSQVREGVSGDGQMIYNTGILPLQRGAACVLFGENTFPGWAHLYTNSTTISPNFEAVWNQGVVGKSYGYKSLIAPQKRRAEWNDRDVMNKYIQFSDTNKRQPYCVQVITISMHSPFTKHNYGEIEFAKNTPQILQNYMRCVHYTDSCIGTIMESCYERSDNSLLVITGDHTILKSMLLSEMQSYFDEHGIAIKEGKNYVPLIVYSSDIKERIEIDQECYQIDIYPTILHLIGCEDYYWKGFGVNLLDSAARHNRPCTEEEAYQLSDKLIRSNWFEKYSEE